MVGRVVLTGDGPPGPEELAATARGPGARGVGEVVAARPASLCVESEGQPRPAGVDSGGQAVPAQPPQLGAIRLPVQHRQLVGGAVGRAGDAEVPEVDGDVVAGRDGDGEGAVRVGRYSRGPGGTEDPAVISVVISLAGGESVLQPEPWPGYAGV